jgi:DNA end-binding protein Ku
MMSTVWSGSISFGLVNIPIRLYTAVDSQTIGFRLLHKKDKVPIQYKRWCPKHKKEVSWDEVAKGFEVEKNKFYVFEKKELEKIKPKRTDTIDIVQIIDAWQIDPIYFDHHYYLGPDNEKEKAYFLFKHVLEESAKAAIGRFVMKDKEHVCVIESYKKGMLLTTLNYAYEIRSLDKIDYLKNPPALKKQEIELATQLIEKLEKKEFDITEFKDTYMNELKTLIKKKSKGALVEVIEEPRKAKKEKNLIEALKASL